MLKSLYTLRHASFTLQIFEARRPSFDALLDVKQFTKVKKGHSRNNSDGIIAVQKGHSTRNESMDSVTSDLKSPAMNPLLSELQMRFRQDSEKSTISVKSPSRKSSFHGISGGAVSRTPSTKATKFSESMESVFSNVSMSYTVSRNVA